MSIPAKENRRIATVSILVILVILILACRPKPQSEPLVKGPAVKRIETPVAEEVASDGTRPDSICVEMKSGSSADSAGQAEVYDPDLDKSAIDSIIKQTAQPLAEGSDIRILQPMTYHSDEVENDTEDRQWYALVRDDEKFFLKKVALRIKITLDPVLDEDGVPTGKEVVVEGSPPLILISGLEGVQEGEVPWIQIPYPFYPGDTLIFKPGKDTYQICAWGNYRENINMIGPYLLQVSSSSDNHLLKQIFAATYGISDTNFRFIWAGDIDHDGKPDAIVDLSDHYNVSRLVLFLSSMAGEGEILHPVAERRSVGC